MRQSRSKGKCSDLEDLLYTMGSGVSKDASKDYNSAEGSSSGITGSLPDQDPRIFTLLGTGGVGKSTVMKQMIRANGFSDEDKDFCRAVLGKNVRILVDEWIKFITEQEQVLDPLLYHRIETFQQLKNQNVEEFFPAERKHFLELSNEIWNDESLRHLQEDFIATTSHKSAVAAEVLSTLKFLSEDNFQRISAEDYVPSDEDLVNLRTQTNDLSEKTFEFDRKAFILRDIGGQT
jgi:GTPase SAR1 family protein